MTDGGGFDRLFDDALARERTLAAPPRPRV